ncbi:MAG: hypothetical protein SNJ56_06450, partial [Termitinemataceae bacterium]
MIPLLATLAFNQMQWIQDIGLRERYRLIQSFHATANQLRNSIQNEITVIPMLFDFDSDEIDAMLIHADTSEMQKRFEAWQTYSKSPEILSALYIGLEQEPGLFTEQIWRWDGKRLHREDAPPDTSGLFVFRIRPGIAGGAA